MKQSNTQFAPHSLWNEGPTKESILFGVLSFVAGCFLGGPANGTKPVIGLGMAQRNVAAALVVGAHNFQDPNVVVMLIVGTLLMLVVLGWSSAANWANGQINRPPLDRLAYKVYNVW